MQRPALQLQLLRAAIAELRDVAIERRPQFRRGIHRVPIRPRQPRDQLRLPAHHSAHLADHPRRLRRNDVALSDQHVRQEGPAIVAARLLHRLLRQPERDHAEEIVHQRRIPLRQQLPLQQAIFSRQSSRTHRVDLGIRPRQRSVQPCIELRNRPLDPDLVPDQPKAHAPEFQIIDELLPSAVRRRRNTVGHLLRQRLGHAHHPFHEFPVRLEPRKQRQRAIPVQQVVIDPPIHAPEHVLEHRAMLIHILRGHAHQPRKRLVDMRIDISRERKCQRRRHAGIALDDVGVVPDGLPNSGVILG